MLRLMLDQILNQPHELLKLANHIDLPKNAFSSPLLRGRTSTQSSFKKYICTENQLAHRDRACPTNGLDCGFTSRARSNFIRSTFYLPVTYFS